MNTAAAPARVLSIETGLVCRNVHHMIAFCTHALGFDLTESIEVPGLGTISRLRRDEASIKLFAPEAQVEPAASHTYETWQSPGGWRYVTICLDSRDAIEEVARRAVDSGGRVLKEPHEYRPGHFVVVFVDPEENVWEFIHRAEPIP